MTDKEPTPKFNNSLEADAHNWDERELPTSFIKEEKMDKPQYRKFTDKEILGLIPAQALIDIDRAKAVLKKVWQDGAVAMEAYYKELAEEAEIQKEEEGSRLKRIDEYIQQMVAYDPNYMLRALVESKEWQEFLKGEGIE